MHQIHTDYQNIEEQQLIGLDDGIVGGIELEFVVLLPYHGHASTFGVSEKLQRVQAGLETRCSHVFVPIQSNQR